MFDDSNLVSVAGLVPAFRLAERAGWGDLMAEVSLGSPNAAAKVGCVVAGMVAGADSIDDLNLLRHGGMGRLFAGVRAPSTLGTFLRSFTVGEVDRLDAAGAQLLARLAAQIPDLVAGAGTAEQVTFVDVDDTIREVHGYAKQGSAYGYSGQRGLNVQLATISTPQTAPVIARARLRAGNTGSPVGAAELLSEALTTARACGVSGPVLVRADSAYYSHRFVATAVQHQVWFSVTAKLNPAVRAAISAIDDQAWTPIVYPQAIWDHDEQRWISDAEVAEIPFTAFTSHRKTEQLPCRLIVRRVRRLHRAAADGSVQDELLTAYRHHAVITNSPLDLIAADEHHRDHAIVEQVIAELKAGPLAHLPSGNLTANTAWVAHTVIAFNLARATAVAANLAKARWATVRRTIINIPARIAATGRKLILHLPRHWPWNAPWTTLWATATSPPAATTT